MAAGNQPESPDHTRSNRVDLDPPLVGVLRFARTGEASKPEGVLRRSRRTDSCGTVFLVVLRLLFDPRSASPGSSTRLAPLPGSSIIDASSLGLELAPCHPLVASWRDAGPPCWTAFIPDPRRFNDQPPSRRGRGASFESLMPGVSRYPEPCAPVDAQRKCLRSRSHATARTSTTTSLRLTP